MQRGDRYQQNVDTFLTNDFVNAIDMNHHFISLLIHLSNKTLKSVKPWKNTVHDIRHPKVKPWYDRDCADAKRYLNKILKQVDKLPTSDFNRNKYYRTKKDYFKTLRRKKRIYFSELNSKIESGIVLDWTALKKLKKESSSRRDAFDDHDRAIFTSFFKELYSAESNKMSVSDRESYRLEALSINSNANQSLDQYDILNSALTMKELDACLKSLKTGKSSGDDMMSNDILKLLDASNKQCLLKLFNRCFDDGMYPWNNSIVTPLHKKGEQSNFTKKCHYPSNSKIMPNNNSAMLKH